VHERDWHEARVAKRDSNTMYALVAQAHAHAHDHSHDHDHDHDHDHAPLGPS
jgi:hypothetical protein